MTHKHKGPAVVTESVPVDPLAPVAERELRIVFTFKSTMPLPVILQMFQIVGAPINAKVSCDEVSV